MENSEALNFGILTSYFLFPRIHENCYCGKTLMTLIDFGLPGVIVYIGIIIYSIVFHEVSHGFAARSMGDRTAEYLGRLTLNPLKHLDFFGSFLLPLGLLLFSHGQFGFGYAKPVPYDPHNLSDKRWGAAKVGLAGPAANIALACLFGIFIRLAGPFLGDFGNAAAATVVLMNLWLAAFNLMPVPPLDGHWLLLAILPPGMIGFKLALFRMQWLLLGLVIFFFPPAVYPLIKVVFTLLTGLRF
jgi:Zn-dependent protease